MNKYLEKIALTRVVSEFAKGTISKPLSELVSKGFIRSEGVYAKGLAKGNRVLAKKTDSKIYKANNPITNYVATMGGGYATLPMSYGKVKNHIVHLGTGVAPGLELKNTPLLHQGLIRHELLEATESNISRLNRENLGHKYQKTISKILRPSSELGTMLGMSKPDIGFLKSTMAIKPAVFMHPQGGLVGMHMSPRVLTRESELVRKTPHLRDTMVGIRDMTGESNLIKNITGKRYGTDKITPKDNYKAHTLKNDSTMFHPSLQSKVKVFNV